MRLFSFQFLKVAFFLLVLCALLPVRSVFGETPHSKYSTDLSFKHLSTVDGLSQMFVFDVKQDKQGFIWIATQDGLNRYDGSDFKYYRNQFQDPNSISDNYIRSIFIDSKDRLWVATANGLSRYNPKLDSFFNYTHDSNNTNTLSDNLIWNISEDNKGNILVATKTGFHKFNDEEDTFSLIKIRNFSTDVQEIKTVYQDHKSNFWISRYENGIYIVNESLTTAASLQSSNGWQLKINAKTLNDIKFIDDNYWLATENGVYIVSKEYKLREHYTFSENAEDRDNNSRAIQSFPNGDVWIATDNGIRILNIISGDWKHIKKQENNSYSLGNNHVYSLFTDKNDNVWISTLDGVSLYSPSFNIARNSAALNPNLTGYVDSVSIFNSELWFTHDGQLYSERNLERPFMKEQIDDARVIVNDDDRMILLDNAGNLFEVKPETEALISIHENWKEHSQYDQNKELVLLNDTLFYVNLSQTLVAYNSLNKQFSSIEGLENSKVSSFYIQDANTIWLTTLDEQLLKYTIPEKESKTTSFVKTQEFPFKQAQVMVVTDDYALIGTGSHGALLVNLKSGNTLNVNEENGLKNNFIADIIVGSGDTFWLSTNSGISFINAESNVIKNFGQNFGFRNSEYTLHAASIKRSGEVFFGGNKGFDLFDVSDLSSIKQRLNKPVFTSMLIANKTVNSGSPSSTSKFSLTNPIDVLSKIELNYKDSPFSLDFVSPNAKHPEQIGYRYRLLGLDENWIETDNLNRRATYTYPKSGNYTFELEVFDKYQPNLNIRKSLEVYVRPPWWLSSSAILVYSLLALLVLAYILQQMRHKRLYHMQIKQSEERLKLSLWGSGDEMWDWNIKSSKIYRSNIWGILDFPQDGTRNVGGGGETNIHENDNTRIREALQEHIDGNSEHFEVTYRVKDKNGQWIWVLDRGKIVERNDKGQPIRMTGTLKDISQIKRADERLKLFAKCIENISDAVVIYDRKFTIVDVNKAFQRITGKNKQQMIGTQMKFSRYADKFLQAVKFHLLNKGSWHGEIESRRANGEVYLTDLNIDIIRDESGNISHFVGVFSDITKRKETEQELRRLANSDTLTGLPNRSYFQANQAKLVKNKTPHALLVFDLDNFKKVNDSMGHEVGDALLCRVANRIRNIGRKQDTVYRLGGDEFSIIIEDTNDIHTITTIAKNILKTIAEPLKLKSQEIVLYSSIGIVLYPEDGASPQELLKNADTAMYHAKNSGGNKYQFFSESMNKQAVKRLQIESLIRHGLKEDNFSVFYQPKIEISTGKIAGMEALVRFETPSKGIISPAVFIPVSEETGQIIDIGEVVLRKACFATKKWVDAGLFDGRIAVNLSAVQFTQPNLVGMISDILHESQLPAKYLELEITEGTVMDSPQQAIDTMLQIRSMGIHLSLDDFGTGYSSLAYLKKFPLNTLKIDKAFVDDIETSEQGRNMVATIVTIAHNLGLHVVAEGVETNQQLSFLAGLRCEQLQGYLYSKPLAESAFQSYLLSHQITDKSTSFTKSDS